MTKKKKAQIEQRAKLDAKINELTISVSTMDPTNPEYNKYVQALAALTQIRIQMDESNSRIGKDKSVWFDNGIKALGVLGTLFITAVVADRAYAADRSDDILRNKNSLHLCDRLVPPKLLGGGKN